jgi:tetratricopeptide (TPR) repeat protein
MKLFLSVILLATLAVSNVNAATNAPESTKAERNFIREGNAKFNTGNYHEALGLYEKALSANPASLTAEYNKAVALTKLASDDNKGTENDPRKVAAELFQDITRINTDKSLAEKSFYNLCNMAFNDENYAGAIEMYKGSLRINPKNVKARQNLRLAQLKQQNKDDNKDDQNKDKDKDKDQQQQDQQQQQQNQQQQQQDQQQQQQQQQPMTGNAEQILQTMQNKENATRRKVKEQDAQPGGRRTTDKPW